MVLKSEAAILCASPSDRLENTFCSAGTITLEKYRFLNEKAMFLVSARGKNVIRRPQLRYGKPIRSLRRSSPDRPRIKPRNATLFERRQISFFASADLLRYIQDSRVCENSPIKLQTLGMTKGRAALPCTAAKQTLGEEEGGVFVGACLATTIYGSVTLPFVIPSAAEGSAVRPGSRSKVWVLRVLRQTLASWVVLIPVVQISSFEPSGSCGYDAQPFTTSVLRPTSSAPGPPAHSPGIQPALPDGPSPRTQPDRSRWALEAEPGWSAKRDSTRLAITRWCRQPGYTPAQ